MLIELRRVKGDPTARRMLVSRRFGDQDVTARLVGHRYVVERRRRRTAEPGRRTGRRAAPPRCPPTSQATLDALRQAGPGGLTAEALQVATGGAGDHRLPAPGAPWRASAWPAARAPA